MPTSFKRPILYGLSAGMRTTAPLVACAKAQRPWQWYPLLGELVVDKLPWTPSRLQLGAWVGRVATASYGIDQEVRRSEPRLWEHVFVAGAVAAVSTKVAHTVRRVLTRRFGLPDILVACVEDGLMLACVVHLRDREGTLDAS